MKLLSYSLIIFLLIGLLGCLEELDPSPSATPSPTATTRPTPTFTPTPSPTATLTLQAEPQGEAPTPSPSPTATTTPTPLILPLAPQALLSPMSHDWQKWNNCAPAAASMVLSYYGIEKTQFEIAAVLRGPNDDKHVRPEEIVDYLAGFGLRGKVRVNGDAEVLMRFISNGIPVIVQTQLNPDEDIGHYLVVRGYDRAEGVIIVNDPYYGPKFRFSYARLDRVWRPFNRCYIPVYPVHSEALVKEILGDDYHDKEMYARALNAALKETEEMPQDAHAWFNLGDDYLALGEYDLAVEAYERAIEIGLSPRTFWYQFGPIVACNKVGRYERVLELTAPVLARVRGIEELHYQRGLAYLGLGEREKAEAEFRLALKYNPRYAEAGEALANLE